ncbi:MAG: transcriptional regulatory protein NadR [Comamonadaceae bacterium]|nr:MAG: transcriptional regulatory protein NadR [Comamonadaceae bacterium]
MVMPQLIGLIGAECTGKTTLAQALATHFDGLWVPEFLRTFCQQQGRTPRMDEQGFIMRSQFDLEEQLLAQARHTGCALVFCDTTLLLTAIYSAHYFADTSLLDAAHAMQRRYALSLVLRPDISWEPDGWLRDGVPARAAVDAQVLHLMQTQRYPHIQVSGVGLQRLQAAILAVETLRI